MSTYKGQILGPFWAFNAGGTSWTDATGIVLDGATEKIAFKYYPSTTSAITDVDVRLNVVGNPGNFRTGVFAHDATNNAPNDAAQLGTYSGDWDLAADGYTGLQTLATNTGALTLNTPVWIVIALGAAGGSVDGSNYIQLQRLSGATVSQNRDMMRHYAGADWTTTASQIMLPAFAVKHADLTYSGNPIGLEARSTQADIFTNAGTIQTQGIRFKSGSQIKVLGVYYHLTKSGTPDNLTFTVYQGDTSKYSSTEVAANVISIGRSMSWFTSPVLLAADTDLFILATQTGTSDANDYDLHTFTIDATYMSALAPTDFRFVHGNGTTPSALTVSTTEFPLMFPIIDDTASDLDSAVSRPPFIIGG